MELKKSMLNLNLDFLKRLNILSFTLVPISLLIGDKFTLVSLLLFIITTCLQYKLKELFHQIKIVLKNRWTILFSLIYIIQLLRFPYFDNQADNFFSANDTQSSLLIIPIIVHMPRFLTSSRRE